jgi:hypothetical protein
MHGFPGEVADVVHSQLSILFNLIACLKEAIHVEI